jgi:hypothetical protein
MPAEKKAVTTTDAWRAFSRKPPQAATIWLERLGAVDEPTVRGLVDEVPPQRMSQISRDFTLQLLLENQRRLLAGDAL